MSQMLEFRRIKYRHVHFLKKNYISIYISVGIKKILKELQDYQKIKYTRVYHTLFTTPYNLVSLKKESINPPSRPQQY